MKKILIVLCVASLFSCTIITNKFEAVLEEEIHEQAWNYQIDQRTKNMHPADRQLVREMAGDSGYDESTHAPSVCFICIGYKNRPK